MLKEIEYVMRDNRPDMAMQTLSGWEEQSPEIRQIALYKRYLERDEVILAQAQVRCDEASLIEYLSKYLRPNI